MTTAAAALPVRLAPIAAAATVPLRHAVLRPMQTPADCVYPLDEAPGTHHAGAWLDDRLVGVASVFDEAEDGAGGRGEWRLRGMAVDPDFRGRHVGASLLHAVIAHCALQQEGGLLWCNGRTEVEPFYRRFGFVRMGAPFDLPPLGPHVVLHRPLGPGDCVYRM